MRTFWIFLISICSVQCNSQGSSNINIPKSKTLVYQLGENNIHLVVEEFGDNHDIVCINLHDDENASVNAARKLLETHGGFLIRIQNNNERLIRFRYQDKLYKIDPNRIFSREGIISNLSDLHNPSVAAADQIERFGSFILSQLPGSFKCIIALHNNTDGAYSALSYQPGKSLELDAKKTYINPEEDPDNFILTTDKIIYEKMVQWKFNSILQDNQRAEKDGSLSIYFGEKDQPYINIETEDGNETDYIKMMEKLILGLKQ